MRPIIRRKSQPARSRRTFKDWIDVVLPVATLCLGVVSLWTTVQVSGLEDYFRSEISRRNEEIGDLSARSRVAEIRLSARETRMDQLSSSAEQLNLLNEEQRLAFSKATADLALLRSEAHIINGQLEGAISDKRRVEAELNEQVRSLEVMSRQELYGMVSSRAFFLRMNALAGFDRSTPGIRMLGAEFRQALMTLHLTDKRLLRYLPDLQSKFDEVCPAFRSMSITFPSPPADVDYSAPPFRLLQSAADREGL